MKSEKNFQCKPDRFMVQLQGKSGKYFQIEVRTQTSPNDPGKNSESHRRKNQVIIGIIFQKHEETVPREVKSPPKKKTSRGSHINLFTLRESHVNLSALTYTSVNFVMKLSHKRCEFQLNQTYLLFSFGALYFKTSLYTPFEKFVLNSALSSAHIVNA